MTRKFKDIFTENYIYPIFDVYSIYIISVYTSKTHGKGYRKCLYHGK